MSGKMGLMSLEQIAKISTQELPKSRVGLARISFIHDVKEGIATLSDNPETVTGVANDLIQWYSDNVKGMGGEQTEQFSTVIGEIAKRDPYFGAFVLDSIKRVRSPEYVMLALNNGYCAAMLEGNVDKRALFNKWSKDYLKPSNNNEHTMYILSLRGTKNPVAEIEKEYGRIKGFNYSGKRLELRFGRQEDKKSKTINIPLVGLNGEQTAYIRDLVGSITDIVGEKTTRLLRKVKETTIRYAPGR